MNGGAAAVLNDITAMAGVEPAEVRFTGADPILPTPLRVGDLGAAAIGAAAGQAARLYERRTGRAQQVGVAVDAAAVAMRSWTYLRDAGSSTREPPVDGRQFFLTADGRWIFLHRRAAHHAERQQRVLGCGGTGAELVEAISRRDGAELEEAIAQAQACSALVRTHAEWARHGQGTAMAGMPLFEITKIGDSQPIPVGNGDRPLAGLRVLDVTHVLAGPTCARTLAEHGADVLRIAMRSHSDASPMTRDTGHGKRSCVLDLKSAGGADVLRALAADADVFSQGYRPGAMAALGFSAEELAERRPGIVYLSLSAFGTAGPWRERRGFDTVVQSVCGFADEMAVGGEPRLLPVSALDYTTGYLAAFLVMVALERRAREGGSYHVRLSLAQTGRYLDRLGRADAAEVAGRAPELPSERLDQLLTRRRTPFGTLRYLAPVADLPLTPARWDRPTVPLDHDGPLWT